MKILLVHNHYRQRSGEDVVFELERNMLRQRGHHVATYCRSNEEIHLPGALDSLKLLGEAFWSLKTTREVSALLRACKPDVVHMHNTFPRISPSIYSACGEAGVPVVQTLHNYRLFCAAGTFFRDGRVCEACLEGGALPGVLHGCYRDSRAATAASALLHAAHHQLGTWSRGVQIFVALTPFARDKFAQAGISPAAIRIKPNFVDPDPGASRGGGRYALFVGRLSPEKSVDVLLDAWGRMKSGVPLLIVGGGPQLEALETAAARRRIHSARFLGTQPRNTTMELMRNARFLVCCSGWYESFPMVIAEAFACGVPVIAPRLGAMQDLVADRRTGLHYAPGDAAELSERAAWAWAHEKEMEAFGREARLEYESKYTAAKNYPILMRIYQEAAAGVGARAASAHPWAHFVPLRVFPPE